MACGALEGPGEAPRVTPGVRVRDTPRPARVCPADQEL